MPIITLTTDFGLQDGFVGIMKGVILGICPTARLVDLTHAVPPQDIMQGALVLARAWDFFPAGTINLAVVDPGVGTARRPLAARLGERYFVGPDNGLLSPLLESAEAAHLSMEFIHLTESNYWLPSVSRTFHGRDIFAPVAAHLANGVPLSRLGPALKDPVRLTLPKPARTSSGWQAHIVGEDHFGNLASDLSAEQLFALEIIQVRCKGRQVFGLAASYGERPSGELVALINSMGFLELAVVNGSAASQLDASVGDIIEVITQDKVE